LTQLYVDNEQYIFIDDEAEGNLVSDDLKERYNLALIEWETVQDELEEIFKNNDR